MNKFVDFEVESSEILDDAQESQFATAKVQAFSSSINKHQMSCSEEVLQKTAFSIYNKPILYNINIIKDDFGTHTNPAKSLIAGFVVPDSGEFIRLDDGRLSLVVEVKLWKRYAPKVIEIFRRDGKNKKVSVEMFVIEAEERIDGIVEMLDFVYAGICLLGKGIDEASQGANIEVLTFAKENSEYLDAYNLEFAKYDNIDFTIPIKIKTNVEKGITIKKEYNFISPPSYKRFSNYLLKNKTVNVKMLKDIYKAFNKYKDIDIKPKDPPTLEYSNWLTIGGSDGWKWSRNLYQSITEQDNTHLSYYNDITTFPYTNISDINPALKGIEPPISLAQANSIASQADAIDGEGWGITIAHFKKTHQVHNDQWVKKEDYTEMKDELKFEDDKEVEKEKLPESKEEEKEEEETEEEMTTPVVETNPNDGKANMSLDDYLDVAALLAMLVDETDSYAKVVEDELKKDEKDFGKVCAAMFGKMSKMTSDMEKIKDSNKTYMDENMELKKYKSDMESNQFEYIVASTLKEIESAVEIPMENLARLKEDASNYCLNTVDGWQNAAKAEAFSFTSKSISNGGIKKYGLPWGSKDENQKKSIWE